MNFDQLSDTDLAALLAQGAAELSRRLKGKSLLDNKGDTQRLEKTDGPSSAEIQHINDCLRIFQKSGFVYADDVKEYRRIAEKYPDFMKSKRLPVDCRGSAINRWMERSGK